MRQRSAARRGALLLALAVLSGACTSGSAQPECERTTNREWSVARVWNEQALGAIRRDFPAPTVHARNLFHLSAAMWDAWAAYDPVAGGYFVADDIAGDEDEIAAAREEAMSYAAFRLLTHRYREAYGAADSLTEFTATMAALCYDADAATEGDTPAELGNRIATTIIESTGDDGSLEGAGYEDESYQPVNEPMVLVDTSPFELADPNRWQPLAFDVAETQSGLPLPYNIQIFVGPHWGHVDAFALDSSPEGLPIDPGPPPYLGDPGSDAQFRDSAVEVIRYSSLLDPAGAEIIDIGAGSRGDNPLGSNDGDGHAVNPVTGEPYPLNLASRADFGRAVAEFWADGPASETPPGHWNTLANEVSDELDELRIGGTGPVVDRLEWDVKLYFALNGAVHDAAVAAWGAKGHYDYVRPITMIRYMGGLGQSSDPDGAAYHRDGLPLEEGLVEVITVESSAPGERHAHLADHVGSVAVRAWAGNPADPEADAGGVDWILATAWVPYQQSTFVTPAFAGYVSGHSTFSRAAAEVLQAITGSAYFPGGLGEWTIPAGSLEFEAGPAADVVLQWATYYDAADQAGESRLYGGIHVRADDFAGRIMGSECGKAAWAKAQRFFGGASA